MSYDERSCSFRQRIEGAWYCSGTDIANVCNEAALTAARKDKKEIDRQDFLDAVDRIIGGLERKADIITPREKKSIAHHEAGHATVSWLLPYANPLFKVTLIPRGSALGAAWYLPEERKLWTKSQMIDEMCSLIGGRVAEDKHGNSLKFALRFKAYNGRVPKIVINEIRNSYQRTLSGTDYKYKFEFVEFYAVTDGNLSGLEFQNASDDKFPKYEFPPVEVKAGDYIVLHLRMLEPLETCRDEIFGKHNFSREYNGTLLPESTYLGKVLTQDAGESLIEEIWRELTDANLAPRRICGGKTGRNAA